MILCYYEKKILLTIQFKIQHDVYSGDGNYVRTLNPKLLSFLVCTNQGLQRDVVCLG
jgi:hypothetical protein